MARVLRIQGQVWLDDGTDSWFSIGEDYGWQQWGADRQRLGETVDALEAMVGGLQAEEIMGAEDDEPDEQPDDGERPEPPNPEDLWSRQVFVDGVGWIHLTLVPGDQRRGIITADDVARCGTCQRWWDDRQSTAVTPVPAGRCPFETYHGRSS